MISTRSKFYYNYTIDETNNKLDFNEGSGQITATLTSGYYSLTDILTEVARAMTSIGTKTYACQVNRSNRKITISTTDLTNFSLLVSTGTNSFTSVFNAIGFTGSDRTGSNSYTGNNSAGNEFKPQFKLQDYTAFEDWQQAAQATVRKTASGQVEVVKFGNESFAEFNIMYQNNYDHSLNGAIEKDLSGVENLRAFMSYAISKGPFEFMPDRNNPASFYKVILESTPESQDGIGFKLKEIGKAMGFFQTGTIKLRKV